MKYYLQKLVYDVALQTYSIVISFASIFNKKAKEFTQGRKVLWKELEEKFPISDKIAWFHCSSLGEYEQARPVIELFANQMKDYKILLTFFSPSGYKHQKNNTFAYHVSYLPIDSAKNAQRFIKLINPSIAFFVKYEFWYHYSYQLKAQNIPCISFSAIFRQDQTYFSGLFQHFSISILKNFSFFFVQDTASVKILNSNKFYNVVLAGDTRFDRVKQIMETNKQIPLLEKFKSNHLLLVLGSTWSKDIEIAAEGLLALNCKICIAPHEIVKSELDFISHKLNTKKIVFFSKAVEQTIENYDVLVIDNIGMLSTIYKYSDFVYIGGGFGAGIHNILEAAVYGKPIVIGPNYKKFKEAVELKRNHGLFVVDTDEDFKKKVLKLENNESFRKEASKISEHYVQQKVGASEKILNTVIEKFNLTT